MFTKSWTSALLTAITFNRLKAVNLEGNDITINAACALGATTYFGKTNQSTSYASLYYLQTSLSGSAGVVLGTGTTQPTEDDYTLSGSIITAFKYTADVSSEADDSGVTLTAIYTITNTSSSDFTIGEIGIICPLANNSGSLSNNSLLERTVLDTPLTIPAGGIGQVTYKIRVNNPIT